MKKLLLLLPLLQFSFAAETNAQCGSVCGLQIVDCQYTPATLGCNGYAYWILTGAPIAYIYNDQGVDITGGVGMAFYWGGQTYSGGISLPPGTYTAGFSFPPSDTCGSISFAIPGDPPGDAISVTLDPVLPVSRCSTGSMIATYSISQPNCLPQPTATLTHDAGTIQGLFQAPNQFLFANVPNSNSVAVSVTAGSASGSASTVFLGPCDSGSGGAGNTTPATAGCANGTITGTLPSAGACGSGGLQIKKLPEMSLVNDYVVNGTSFTATVAPGEYEVTMSTDSETPYPCPAQPYTVVVEQQGVVSASVDLNATPSGLGCPNGSVSITIQPNAGCVVAVNLGAWINGDHQSWGTFNYDGTNSISHTVGHLPPGEHSVVVTLVPGTGAWETSDHPFTIENNGEFVAQEQYVLDEDGDDHFTDGPQPFCVAPQGWVLLTDSLISGDCAPQNHEYYAYQQYVKDEDVDGHYTEGPEFYCDEVPEGWVVFVSASMTLGDCAPQDGGYFVNEDYVKDEDGDNHYTEGPQPYCDDAPEGWVLMTVSLIPGDCSPQNAAYYVNKDYVKDEDGDDHYIAGPVNYCDGVPLGWVEYDQSIHVLGDCNDDPALNGNLVFEETTLVLDADHDSYYVEGSDVFGCIPLTDYVVLAAGMTEGDCDDDDPSVHATVAFVVDADGDGYYLGEPEYYCQGAAPNGWLVLNGQIGGDCNDDPNAGGQLQSPGHAGTWSGMDNNCDGFILELQHETVFVGIDFNDDGMEDSLDRDALLAHFGCAVAQNPDCGIYDMDDDGVVGASDMMQFNSAYNGN